MKIAIKVIPRSSQKKIVEEGDLLRVYVHESATDGKANGAVCALLAKKYDVPKTNVVILKGTASRMKIVEIVQ